MEKKDGLREMPAGAVYIRYIFNFLREINVYIVYLKRCFNVKNVFYDVNTIYDNVLYIKHLTKIG